MSLVELLSKLISFRSITPNDDGCLEFITKILLNMGFKCKNLILEILQTNKKYMHIFQEDLEHTFALLAMLM